MKLKRAGSGRRSGVVEVQNLPAMLLTTSRRTFRLNPILALGRSAYQCAEPFTKLKVKNIFYVIAGLARERRKLLT
jgi:hypothetical protein